MRACRQSLASVSHHRHMMASLAVSSALWLTATSANPIGVEIAEQFGVKISFGSWLLAASVPALALFESSADARNVPRVGVFSEKAQA